jgi:signal transduction histidine kinase
VGILGTQQKKFLERIRGSSQRINVMIEDVSRANERMARRPVSPFEAVSLTQVIDSAVDQVRPQILEKSIALRVDLPKGLPRLRTDRAALQKILVSLLENANHVTPNSGEVTLRARLKGEPETQDYLLVQVTDQGGSIPLGSSPEGISPAATRVDQASASAAVRFEGLPMVKAMVENLSGRIWVDSEIGVGSTYSLLLPVSPKSSSDLGSGVAQ